MEMIQAMIAVAGGCVGTAAAAAAAAADWFEPSEGRVREMYVVGAISNMRE